MPPGYHVNRTEKVGTVLAWSDTNRSHHQNIGEKGVPGHRPKRRVASPIAAACSYSPPGQQFTPIAFELSCRGRAAAQ
jgi:hypothetical protein